MRLGFLGVTLGLVSVAAVACGGNAIGAGDEGDAEPAAPAERDGARLGGEYVSHCDELVVAVKHYTECTEQSAAADYFESVRTQCERDTEQTPTRCASEFRDLTRCQARDLEACDPEIRSCRPEELAYAQCVSGGTCKSVGGGSHGPRPGGLEAFTTHLACQCLEQDEPNEDERTQAALEGNACDTPFDCPIVCCPCPLPNTEYSGAVCDKSATGGTGRGVCVSADATCAATAFRCDRM